MLAINPHFPRFLLPAGTASFLKVKILPLQHSKNSTIIHQVRKTFFCRKSSVLKCDVTLKPTKGDNVTRHSVLYMLPTTK